MNKQISAHAYGCACNHFSPPKDVLISPTFNHELATYWQSYQMSANSLWDLLLSIWYDHEGSLFDIKRDPIDLWTPDKNGDDFVDRLAGDPVRSLRRYLEFGQTTRVNRLRKEHHNLAMMLHHARSIQKCAHAGLCAAPKD